MDIRLCNGQKSNDNICPKRDSCDRYILSLDEKNINPHRQSWLMEAPFIIKLSGVSCDMFARIDKIN